MEGIEKISLGRRIKQIRISLGLSMEDFGEYLETSKGAVNNWEKGKNAPNNSRLAKIAEIGNCTIDELLYGNLNESIYSMMRYAENYPGISESTYNDFISEYSSVEDPKLLKLMYDYIAYKNLSSPIKKQDPPIELIKSKEELSDEELLKIDDYYAQLNEGVNKIIFNNALKTAKMAGISPGEKLFIMSILRDEAENLFYRHTKDTDGFLSFAIDKIKELQSSLNSFIYVYNKEGKFTRHENIDEEVENKIFSLIQSLVTEITKEKNN